MSMRKRKIGRNEPCPCGSGVKYKKCHGRASVKLASPSPKLIQEIMQEHEAKESLRQQIQGKGKPIISTEFQGYRITAVGNELHYAKSHRTFIDFLGDYIRTVLTPEWGNSELAKPLDERHQILKWYDSICALQAANTDSSGTIKEMPINGLVAAYFGLAYNLYLLGHNAELQEFLISRLRRQESFYAAYYETYVAAWFILAGFELKLEDEQDSSTTHPEFIASRGGVSYSVEAKARQAGKEHFDIGNQLYKALKIESKYPRVVFIDMNVGTDTNFDQMGHEALRAIQSREEGMKIKGQPAPPAHVFVTNQPYHLALDETELPRACLMTGFKISDFGHGAKFNSYTEAYKSRVKYSALTDVQKAITNYNFPMTFDGELPEFSLGKTDRRFTIGNKYEVSKGEFLTLESGIVLRVDKTACLVFANDIGQSKIVTIELTDAEISAYNAHPETFFGRKVPVSGSVNSPIELFEFFVNGYKDTPRERLLELVSSAPNFEYLKLLSDEELLYAYAEGLTRSNSSRRK